MAWSTMVGEKGLRLDFGLGWAGLGWTKGQRWSEGVDRYGGGIQNGTCLCRLNSKGYKLRFVYVA